MPVLAVKNRITYVD